MQCYQVSGYCQYNDATEYRISNVIEFESQWRMVITTRIEVTVLTAHRYSEATWPRIHLKAIRNSGG